MAVELAIRQWARSDELAAGAAAHVDAVRLKNVGEFFRATGLPAEEADAQAFLFYCFVFGQGLLFLERGPRKRAQLVAKLGRNTAPRIVGAAEASGRARVVCRSGRALQLLGAFAVVAAALLDPLQAAIGVAGLVGIVLVHARVHARLAGGLLGIFGIDGVRIDRGA